MTGPKTETRPSGSDPSVPTGEPAAVEAPKLKKRERSLQFRRTLAAVALKQGGAILTPVEEALVASGDLSPKNKKEEALVTYALDVADRMNRLSNSARRAENSRHRIERNRDRGFVHLTPVTKEHIEHEKAELEHHYKAGHMTDQEYWIAKHKLDKEHPSNAMHSFHYREMTPEEKAAPETPGKAEIDANRQFAGHAWELRYLGREKGIRAKRRHRKEAKEAVKAASIDWDGMLEIHSLLEYRRKLDETARATVDKLVHDAASSGITIDRDAAMRDAKAKAWKDLEPSFLGPEISKKDLRNSKIVPPENEAEFEDLVLHKTNAELLQWHIDKVEAETAASEAVAAVEREATPIGPEAAPIYTGTYYYAGEKEPVVITKRFQKGGKPYVYVQGRVTPIPEEQVEIDDPTSPEAPALYEAKLHAFGTEEPVAVTKQFEQDGKQFAVIRGLDTPVPLEMIESTAPRHTTVLSKGMYEYAPGKKQPVEIVRRFMHGGRQYVMLKEGPGFPIPADQIKPVSKEMPKINPGERGIWHAPGGDVEVMIEKVIAKDGEKIYVKLAGVELVVPLDDLSFGETITDEPEAEAES